MVREFLNGFRALVQRLGEDWELQERRTLVRLRCEYRCLFAVQGKRAPGVITDLGEGGLGLRTSSPLEVGQKVTVYCPFVELEGEFSPVQATVCWVRANADRASSQAGLRYDAGPEELSSTWLEAILQLLGFPHRNTPTRRRWVRLECELPAQLGDRVATVHNLGVGGALLKLEKKVACGTWALRLAALGKAPAMTLTGELMELPGREGSGWYALVFEELQPETLQPLGLHLKELLRRSWERRPQSSSSSP